MRDAPEECEPEWLDAEDPLFILYTSGSTGKPKVGHQCAPSTLAETWRKSAEKNNKREGLFYYSTVPGLALTLLSCT